jgi:hypothetical protein
MSGTIVLKASKPSQIDPRLWPKSVRACVSAVVLVCFGMYSHGHCTSSCTRLMQLSSDKNLLPLDSGRPKAYCCERLPDISKPRPNLFASETRTRQVVMAARQSSFSPCGVSLRRYSPYPPCKQCSDNPDILIGVPSPHTITPELFMVSRVGSSDTKLTITFI